MNQNAHGGESSILNIYLSRIPRTSKSSELTRLEKVGALCLHDTVAFRIYR